ncbi:MAG TPA: hypothetical protein PLN53_08355 [Terricaulis sp.]|nr:hypothetical protein [Terricaulis sp.]
MEQSKLHTVTPYPPEMAELRRDLVRIKYEQGLASVSDRSKAVFEFAYIALKSLILVHGGALIGLLTFLGNFPQAANASGAWWAYAAFVFGLFTALLAVIFSYAAQTYFFWAEGSNPEIEAMQSFGLDTSEAAKPAQKNARTGIRYQLCAVGSGAISALAFLGGAFVALGAVVVPAA